MTMTWILKNAKYVIYTFGFLLLVGLIMMGAFDQNNGRMATNIGTIDGVPISLEEFRQLLTNMQEQERNRTGKGPEGLQLALMRKNLFDYKVRSIILSKFQQNYKLIASGEEMWNFLEQNPDPAIQKESLFQTNSKFDIEKYKSWLHQDNTLDLPYMKYMEQRMKQEIIPEQQFKQLISVQYHPTSLETAFEDLRNKNKAKFYYYLCPFDSFPISQEAFTDQQAKAYYSAHPDSFISNQASTQLGYIHFEIKPSKADTNLALEIISDLKLRISSDSNFAELAISYSDDEGSAENGGSLGGFQPRQSWVEPFADAAFNLSPGDISDPVLTPFGYHLIKCNDTLNDNGIKKVDASHILIKIEPTPETVDSLVEKMENIRNLALEHQDFKQIANQNSQNYLETDVIFKGNYSPLGEFNYIPGLHSFAFGKLSEKETISEVLQNDKGIFLFGKQKIFSKGRDFNRDKNKVFKALIKEKQIEAAKAEIGKVITALKDKNYTSFPDKLFKAKLDSSGLISAKSWLSGFGYDHPSISQVFTQSLNQWGKPIISDFGVLTAIVTEKQDINIESLLPSASPLSPDNQVLSVNNIEDQWFKDNINKVNIENNLDMIYRN